MAFLFVSSFPDEIACSSILRNELTRFTSGAVVSFAEKNGTYEKFKIKVTVFFYVLTHKSSWHFGKEFPVKLPVARASGEH